MGKSYENIPNKMELLQSQAPAGSVVTILLCEGKSSLSDKWLKSLEIHLSKVSGVGGWPL